MGLRSGMERREAARRLRELRIGLGMSQQHLADAAGLDRTQVSKYERAEHLPSANAVKSLAAALRTTTDHLLGKSESAAVAARHPAPPRRT